MKYPAWVGRLGIRSGSALLVACGVLAAIPAHAAGGTVVTNFYTTTLAAYNAWTGKGVPVQALNLPAGRHTVPFYFSYTGAAGTAKRHFEVYNGAGKNLFDGADKSLTVASAERMAGLEFGKPLARGLYRADLVLSDGGLATTSFTVGVNSPLTSFYPISSATYDTLNKQVATPATYRVPSGAHAIAFYYRVARSAPKTTTVQVVLYDTRYDSAAHTWKDGLVFTGKVLKVGDKGIGYEGAREITSTTSLDDAHYLGVLRLNGQPVAEAVITVGM